MPGGLKNRKSSEQIHARGLLTPTHTHADTITEQILACMHTNKHLVAHAGGNYLTLTCVHTKKQDYRDSKACLVQKRTTNSVSGLVCMCLSTQHVRRRSYVMIEKVFPASTSAFVLY